jgi:hypothetical protein
MLRMTSDVPPSMELARERRNDFVTSALVIAKPSGRIMS